MLVPTPKSTLAITSFSHPDTHSVPATELLPQVSPPDDLPGGVPVLSAEADHAGGAAGAQMIPGHRHRRAVEVGGLGRGGGGHRSGRGRG